MAWLEKTNHARDKKAEAREKLNAWIKVRKQVLERDDYRCRACASPDQVDVHHIKFRSAGGKDTAPNLAAICRSCHADLHGYRLSVIGDNANGRLRFVRRG